METTGVDTRKAQSLGIRLTQVELVYEQGVRNYRLLFGRPFKVVTQERTYGRMTKQLALFKPGDELYLVSHRNQTTFSQEALINRLEVDELASVRTIKMNNLDLLVD